MNIRRNRSRSEKTPAAGHDRLHRPRPGREQIRSGADSSPDRKYDSGSGAFFLDKQADFFYHIFKEPGAQNFEGRRMHMTIDSLMEELKRNPVGLELLKNAKGTQSQEECAAVLADISARCGIEVSQAEILSMIQAEEAERNRRYEAAKEEIAELADDDVEDVAGGVYRYENADNVRPIGQFVDHIRVEGCKYDFTDDDCIIFDACDSVLERYYGCYSGQFVDCEHPQEPVKV